MPQQSGFELYKRFYPWPSTYRLGDPVLVSAVTGMTWPEFLQGLQAQSEAIEMAREMGAEAPAADQVVVTGMIAVAFWQGNPTMSRDKVRRAIERVSIEDIEIIVGDDDEAADVGPPAEGGETSSTPSTTSSESGASPEGFADSNPLGSTSDAMSQNGSGLPGSLTTSPESLPA